MQNRTMSGGLVSSLLAIVASLGVGCSDTGDASTFEPGPIAPDGLVGTDSGQAAHGWAAVYAEDSAVTNGGAAADAAHIYTVTNRTELVEALYPDAIIAEDGTFTSVNGPDNTAKIIYVQGRISLNTNRAGDELALEDYACEGYDFEAYKTAYDPTTWNRTLVDGEPQEILPCPDTQEELRDCSARNQRAVVLLKVGSNTSLFGLGKDAKIVHGNIVIGGAVPNGAPPQVGIRPLTTDLAEACNIAPPATEPAPPPALDPAAALVATAENVIVRNITFEDAFDFFPAWDPADSYSEPPEQPNPDGLYPLCQLALAADGIAGPHQCPGGRWNSSYDNITVQNARHVWLDNNTFNDGDRETQGIASIWGAPYDLYQNRVQPHDGLLDINGTSDRVTVSRNIFRNHDKVMLIGGSDTVRETNGWGYLNVTVHHNQFINCGQRMPRVRFGKVHVYSNVIRGTLFPQIATAEDRANKPLPAYPMGSALAVGHLAKVYSEANVFNITKGFADDPAPTAADVVSTAHRATPTEGTTPDVGQQTYFFDDGSTLTTGGTTAPVDLMKSVQEQVVADEDPAIPSTEDVWKPEDDYEYRTTAAGGVVAELGRLSGAGRLSVSARE